MSSMPLPVSLTLICSDLSSISHSTVIMPRLPLYACTVQFVTASETAVFMSPSSVNVISNWDTKQATAPLAKASFDDFEGNWMDIVFISFICNCPLYESEDIVISRSMPEASSTRIGWDGTFSTHSLPPSSLMCL